MNKPNDHKKKIARVVARLMETSKDRKAMNLQEGLDLPDRNIVIACLERLHSILFPGFVSCHPITLSNLEYYLGDMVNHVYLELVEEAKRAFRYDCKVGNCKYCKTSKCKRCNIEDKADEAVMHLLDELPRIREICKKDMQAGYDGDPAASSIDEIIVAYPSAFAVATYRLAHELYVKEVPLIPRLWSEHAHTRTGIDIHPGARIGPYFFIDHGTGVVVGETTTIGTHVEIYQGVTLGALSPAEGQTLRGKKRHPTIEDNVVIYSNATILGGHTVIGHDSVIGGNVWITESVPPETRIMLSKNDPVYSRD